MRILFPEQQAEADRLTCAGQGISSVELMERAVSALSEAIRRRFPHELKQVMIVCGPGNNGGDGLALARQLAAHTSVSIYLPEQNCNQNADHRHMLAILPEKVKRLNKIDFSEFLEKSTLLVEALFGAGLNRPLSGDYASLVQQMNAASCLKIAIDTPCGLFSEMPEQAIAFQANHVFTFHSPKPAFLLPHAEKFVPDFSVLDIRLNLPEPGMDVFSFTEESDIRKLLRPRPKFSHKGTFGHALLMAGSEGKMGAAVLAARACLRSGTGLLSMQVPACGRDVLQLAVPEAMVISDPQYSFISKLPETASFQAIGIGPGIGTSQETSEVLRALFASCKPLVLDADAINLLALHPDLLEILPPDTILTPHPKEFARITGFSGSPYQRWFAARDFAFKHKIYLVLKGAYSLICFPDGQVHFNATGNSGMAKGGSGDVLTGLLTGLLASGYSPGNACRLSVWLHGRAGDLAAIELSSLAMNASDLISFLPQAWKSVTKGR